METFTRTYAVETSNRWGTSRMKVPDGDSYYEQPPEMTQIYGGAVPAQKQQIITSPALVTNTANWSTSLQAMLDQPPSNLPQRIILGGMACCMAFGVWATLGQIEEVRHVQGQIVPPAEIASQDAPLVLVATLPSQETGFVKKGMPVQVKLDASPAWNYGIIPGKVISISPDAQPNEKLGAVYRVEVALARNHVPNNQQTIQFKAGQTVAAEILIHYRIADILLDPMKQLQ